MDEWINGTMNGWGEWMDGYLDEWMCGMNG